MILTRAISGIPVLKLKSFPSAQCKNSRKFPLPKISHVMHVYKHEAYRSDNCTPLRQPLSQSINDRSVSLEMVSFYCAVLSAVSLWRINLSFDRSFSFYRAMLCIRAVYAGMRCLSVCLSVRLSRSRVAPKRMKISSKFFHHRVETPF